jgi:hypothetical protein
MLLLALACSGPLEISDDLSPGPAGRDAQMLHGPYAQGTLFELSAGGSRGSREGWGYEIEDELVVSIEDSFSDRGRVVAIVRAAEPGITTVRLFDDLGWERQVAELEVRAVDTLRVQSRLLDHVDAQPAARQPQIEGTRSVWTVSAMDADGVRLAGLPPLEMDCQGAVGGRLEPGGSQHEVDAYAVLEVSDQADADCVVADEAQTVRAEIALVGVGSSAVIRSALVESMEVTTEETELWLVGRDAQDQVVLGVEGAWSLADQDQGFGDRYVWAHDPMSRPKALQVIPTAGPTPDAVEIRGEGQAKGAGDTGCTSAGGVPAILLGLAGLAALRRRQLSS